MVFGAEGALIGDTRALWNFWNYFNFVKESRGERDEEPPCGRKLVRLPIGKESETPPAESPLRVAPVCN